MPVQSFNYQVVELHDDGAIATWARKEVSSQEGLVLIDNMALSKRYGLLVSAPGYAKIFEKIPASPAEVKVRVSLTRPGELALHVLQQDGAPAGFVKVLIKPLAVSPANPRGRVTKTDKDGMASFRGLVPGRYRVRALASGGWQARKLVDLVAGKRRALRMSLER